MILCDEADCVFMDDNKGCMLSLFPERECPNKLCGSCKHRKWKCNNEWEHEWVCDLNDRVICGSCSKWEIKDDSN